MGIIFFFLMSPCSIVPTLELYIQFVKKIIEKYKCTNPCLLSDSSRLGRKDQVQLHLVSKTFKVYFVILLKYKQSRLMHRQVCIA